MMAERVESQSSQQRCAYYLPAKKRCCKMLVVQGREYCGQHLDAAVSKVVPGTSLNVSTGKTANKLVNFFLGSR